MQVEIRYVLRCYLMGVEQDGGMSGQWYIKWIEFIEAAISCLDKKNFVWLHLPYEGGYYDQDAFIMLIWSIIRIEFISAVNDKEFMGSLKKG